MRLHLLPDEKIINRCISSFESVFPGDNKYIVVPARVQNNGYVTEQYNVFFCKYGTRDFWGKVGDVNQYTSIIIHFLFDERVDFVNKIKHPNIYWIEWGADLYKSLLRPKGFPLYADKDIIWKTEGKYKQRLFFQLHSFVSMKKLQWKTLRAAKKARFFVPDSMYNEYPLLLRYYPRLKHLEYKDFFYYPIDQVLGERLLNSHCNGNNIIVGNSASASNNHEYVFEKLCSLGLDDHDVIVPLSYGNTKLYIDRIEKSGKTLLGDRFKAVRDYMPLEQYNDLLLSGNVFIYGNWRQEAVGNILIALYLGGKVYLDKRNPLLPFYKSLGLTIFCLDELTLDEISTKLSSNVVDKNRSILLATYSLERQQKLIRENF